MATERTLSIIKPDGVFFERPSGRSSRASRPRALKPIGIRMQHLSRPEAEGFYAVHKERPFFKDLLRVHDQRPGGRHGGSRVTTPLRRTAS